MKKILLRVIPILIIGLSVASISYEQYKKVGWISVTDLSSISGVVFDKQNNPWFSNCGKCPFANDKRGVIHYDGDNWIGYSEENSDLSSNDVYDIAIDQSDNVWLDLFQLVKNHSQPCWPFAARGAVNVES